MHGILSRSNVTKSGQSWPVRAASSSLLGAVVLSLAAIVIGCGGSTAATAPASGLPSVAATATPRSSATGAAGSATPVATGSPACAALPVSGGLPGDRLVGVVVMPGTSSDRIALTFGTSPASAPPGPAARPVAVLEAVQPPFVRGGSGQPLVVVGDRFARLVLRNMTIADDAGRPFDTGPAEFRPAGVAIRHLVLAEAFEGVESWIVGLAADAGCMTLGRSADGMTVTIDIGRG